MNTTASGTTVSRQLPAIFTVVFALLGILSLPVAGQIVPHLTALQLHPLSIIDSALKFQGIALIFTAIYLLVIYRVNPENFRRFARIGDMNAPASPVSLLGIKATDRWRRVGLTFAVVVTLGTGIFIYIGLIQGKTLDARMIGAIPWAILLAISNAFVEEAMARFGIIVGTHGILRPSTIYIISALVFGIPHFFGTPGGVIGVLMAGFLGWLLAKAAVETRGMLWAWFIHFLQDVVIFFGILLPFFLV